MIAEIDGKAAPQEAPNDGQATPRRNALGTDTIGPASVADIAAIDAALDELRGGDDEAQPAPVIEKPVELDADQVAAIEALETRDEAIADAYDPNRKVRRMISEKIAEIEADARKDEREAERAKIEHKRELARIRKRRERAKRAGGAKPKRRAPAPLQAPVKTSHDLLRGLEDWIQYSPGKRAARLRAADSRRLKEIARFADHYIWFFHESGAGRRATDGEMAKKMRCSRHRARHTRHLVEHLCAHGGPWHKTA